MSKQLRAEVAEWLYEEWGHFGAWATADTRSREGYGKRADRLLSLVDPDGKLIEPGLSRKQAMALVMVLKRLPDPASYSPDFQSAFALLERLASSDES